MNFEWHSEKAASNFKKHKIEFEEPRTSFDDPLFIAFEDPDHSIEEYRFILMGESIEGRLLVVCYTMRGDIIRLISARKAAPAERGYYEEES